MKTDNFGNTIFKHRIGETVMDDYGSPLIKDGKRGLLRHLDLFLLDARYLFVDNEQDIDYRKTIHSLVNDWCVTDMESIGSQLLERSEIFYYPIRTTGDVNVIADDNKNVTIRAEQQFEVTYWLTETNYRNASLRDMIEKQTILNLQYSLNVS